ncbi:heterokaryon incompatibility protein-domain-containing protein [Hypoxylon argillaceum]|nr:heterokaryon incompatibility protein-domain-containing protein [Hypoxylon argillaceum]
MGPNTNTKSIHRTLADSTIRLLGVHPGKDTEPLTLSLSHVPLQSLPVYEAISYFWGPATDVVPVVCDGVEVSITASLFGALSQFRLPDRSRTLWADAICIDQANLSEKGIQVGLMPQIYSGAERVLIWLGPLDEARILLRLPEWIKETRALIPPPPATFDAPEAAQQFEKLLAEALQRRREGKPNLHDYDWQPLAALVSRPWFRRKWIVQEVVLAREAVLCVDHVRLPWDELALLTYTMAAFELVTVAGESIAKGYRAEKGKGAWTLALSFTIPMQNIAFIQEIQEYRQYATLMDGVMATNHFLCTIEHDHIYALLGLQLKHTAFRADYEISVAESYIRFAKAILFEGQRLKVFGLAPYKSYFAVPDTERLPLPSWVPDLRLIQYVATLVSFSVLKQRFFAGGRDKPILHLSADGLVLHARGRIIDTVQSLAPTWIDRLKVDHPGLRSNTDILELASNAWFNSPFSKWLLDCHRFAVQNAAYPPAELMAAFARTMVCNMNSREGYAEPGMLESFADYLASCEDKAGKEEHKPNPHFMPICSAGSRLGQIPIGAALGDRICVLVGGETPYVIRPTAQGRFRLIGEAYVDGVMDGEALEGSEYIDEDIQIE